MKQSSRRRWTTGVAIVGLVLFGVMMTLGYLGHLAAQPVVLAVEGPLDAITVAGRPGSTPIVTADEAVALSSAKMRIEHRGSGREIQPDTPVLLSVSAYDGTTGANLNEDGNPNLILSTANETELGPLLTRIVTGQTEGSRLLVARPLDDGSTEIDVVDILYTIANGEEVADADGPLQVAFDELGPKVTTLEEEAPSGLIVQVLNKGEGPQVQEGDKVFLQYLAGQWSTGQLVSSTWATGTPTMLDLAEAMPGISEAVIDQRVGSRLAVSIPAEMAKGEDNLFAVIDILGRTPGSNILPADKEDEK